jgi:cephalosporin hydroxylase
MPMEPDDFDREIAARLAANRADGELRRAADAFMKASTTPKYSYNFRWLGRPIIQYPQDIVAMQELIWRLQPDLVIETGIAHGGSLIFSASMLELNAQCGGPAEAMVLGIDIDIRQHNRSAIEKHPMFRRIRMLEGSSVDDGMAAQVKAIAESRRTVLVCLDSNHTHDHVLRELELYAPLTTPGSYCVVFDTIVEDLPAGTYADRQWGPGNSPLSAVRAYVSRTPGFVVDTSFDDKLLISVARSGYLQRVV